MAKRNTENNDKRSEQLRIWVTPEEIEKIEKEEMMVEFAGVVIFFLKKKCKTLEKQGL